MVLASRMMAGTKVTSVAAENQMWGSGTWSKGDEDLKYQVLYSLPKWWFAHICKMPPHALGSFSEDLLRFGFEGIWKSTPIHYCYYFEFFCTHRLLGPEQPQLIH
jgi:hypothetical protein